MADNTTAFDPEKSARARMLNNLSQKELFNRYYMTDNGVSWLKNLNTELNKTKPQNSDEDLYPYLVSLIGKALDFIPSYINKKMMPFIPKNYKLNAAAIARDIEAVLAENIAETRAASRANKANSYIVEAMEFFVERLNDGLNYQLGLTN